MPNLPQNFLTGVDKPSGVSSHDMVYKARRAFGIKRIGHMGTLDPMAEGVLLLGVGSAARLNQYLNLDKKSYEVWAKFGTATNTYDGEGEVVQEAEIPSQIMDPGFAQEFIKNLVGEHMQTPPPFSAIKVNGQRAYKAARAGKNVEIPPRKISIYDTEFVRATNNDWTFKVTVSKGTYIRSLVNDIGAEIGCPAHVSRLVRISSGSITLDDCLSVEEMEAGNYKIVDACKILGFQVLKANEKQAADVGFGKSLSVDNCKFACGDLVSVRSGNSLLAIYQVEEADGLSCKLRPKTVFDGGVALAN